MQGSTFKKLYFVGLIIGAVIRGIYTRNEARNRDRAKAIIKKEGPVVFSLMMLWGVGSQLVPLLYLLTRRLDFADYRFPKKAEACAGWLGTATFAFGLWLLWRSHADLGSNWSPTTEIREDHTLITDGVYRCLWVVAAMEVPR